MIEESEQLDEMTKNHTTELEGARREAVTAQFNLQRQAGDCRHSDETSVVKARNGNIKDNT